MPGLEMWSLCVLGRSFPRTSWKCGDWSAHHCGDRVYAAARAVSVFTREVVTAIWRVMKHEHVRPLSP